MNADIRQVIEDLLDKVAEAYIQDQLAKGIRSSGFSADSIEKHVHNDGGDVTGIKYFYQQRHGRRPGKFPPIQGILNWIMIKGIRPKDPRTSMRSLAFLFARKIAERGTDIFMKRRPALNVDAKIKDLVKGFKYQLTGTVRETIKRQIKAAA